jgi:hypothetical protein
MCCSGRASLVNTFRTHVSKRLFGVVEFHYYAIADGLSYLFKRFGKWKGGREARKQNGPSKQMIFPGLEFG